MGIAYGNQTDGSVCGCAFGTQSFGTDFVVAGKLGAHRADGNRGLDFSGNSIVEVASPREGFKMVGFDGRVSTLRNRVDLDRRIQVLDKRGMI